MRVKTQDPKYDIDIDASSPETARLVNAATGKPILDDELKVLRARLKQGDYDGVDIMKAVLVIDELRELRELISRLS